jgi:PhzF family phenazine biosynthesis protein
MLTSITQVDAFTASAFAGNPAAVCLLPETRSDTWMQQVAAENNLSETAFLLKQEGGFGLRWFTPLAEVNLCGHATLASAHVLWESGLLAGDEIARFHTKSGVLTAVRMGDWIELDFPATPDTPADAPAGLVDALGATPTYVGRSRFDYVLVLDSEDTVRGLRPDFAQLARVEARGVIVTSRAGSSACDFVTRFFAPAVGVNEDPVTGSAHCCLVPYWNRITRKTSFIAHQVSARGGVLRLTFCGTRVKLAGQAITVLRGELLV